MLWRFKLKEIFIIPASFQRQPKQESGGRGADASPSPERSQPDQAGEGAHFSFNAQLEGDKANVRRLENHTFRTESLTVKITAAAHGKYDHEHTCLSVRCVTDSDR